MDNQQSIMERDGHVSTGILASPDLVAQAVTAMDEVLEGKYETGIEPKRVDWRPGDDPTALRRVENPHWSNPVLNRILRESGVGEAARKISGAKSVQAWNVQLLYKPSGATNSKSNVGWHQDLAYWPFWEGEVFTAWLALSDVGADCGPMKFVQASHKWGVLSGSNFWFPGSLEELKKTFKLPAGAVWEEALTLIPAGAASLHHSLTLHGSAANHSGRPRRSLAIHLRTERARYDKTKDKTGAITDLSDLDRYPLIAGNPI